MIYEEKKSGLYSALILIGVMFLLFVSPWALDLRDLYWSEGTYATLVREISSFPPLMTLHGESISGIFPFYPLLVKIVYGAGFSMEFSLRIIVVLSLGILIALVYFCCFQAEGKQAGAAGATVMLTSLIIVDKGLEGNPIILIALGIFAVWLVWFDLGAWRGSWGAAWSTSGLIAGLLFYAGGWEGLVLAVVPLLFLRRPLMLRNKPRGPGFLLAIGLILLFILAWGLPRWHAGVVDAFRPAYGSPGTVKEYLIHVLTFPFEAAFRLLPWSLFAWAPFCPAVITLDRTPLLSKYFRTLFTVLFCILWFSPETQGRDLVYLVPPLAVLIGLNYWIAVRRYGMRYLYLFRVVGGLLFLCGLGGLLFCVLPADVLDGTGWFDRNLSYRNTPFLFYFGVIYCSGSLLLSVLCIFLARKGIQLWALVLLLFGSGILLYWGIMTPYKAASHSRRNIGLELKRALGGKTDHLTVYKFHTLPGLYSECHYMGGRIVTVKDESKLPPDDKIIYVLAPEVPSVPDRTWKSLFNRENNEKQRLTLWRGELRDYEEND